MDVRMPAGKFRRPRLPRSVIDRTWLFLRPPAVPSEALDEWPPEAPVTVVCATAGAGKTTLLSGWARIREQQGDAVAWVSLDRTDADRPLFWQALLAAVREAALRTADRSTADGTDHLDESPAAHHTPLAELDRLVQRSTAPLWLFLDDLQEVSSPGVLADLDTLLRTMPEGLHLVLASRRDPVLALHRLRLAGTLREIHASDLALDRSEVRQLLVHHSVVLDDESLSLLVDRTEGWAAGVRLAALALADATDTGAAVRRFAGDDRAVADYLAAEVLRRLDVRERHLLRLCALPHQLTAELAVEITGDPAAADVLEELSRANVLVAPAQAGGWFRIHTLLRGYLLAQLQRTDLPAVRTAHARVARWFAVGGHLSWAVEHAVQSEDDALAVELVTTHGPSLLAEGRARALHTMIGTSTEAVRADASVRRLDALAVLESDEFTREPLPTSRANSHDDLATPDAVASAAEGCLEALLALHRVRYDLHLSPTVLDATAPLLDDREDDLGLLLGLGRGRVLLLAGRFDEADVELTRSSSLAQAHGNPDALLRVSAHRTAVAAARCRFRDVAELAEETVRIGAETDGEHHHEVAAALLLAAHAARQQLEPTTARQLTDRAGTTADGRAGPEVLVSLRALRAILDVEAGLDPLVGCRLLRKEVAVAAEKSLSPLVVAHLAFLEHRCAWLAGRLDWAREALGRLTALDCPPGEMATLAASEHLARGRFEAARNRIGPVLDQTTPCLFPTTLQQAWLIEALITESAGQHARRHEALRSALDLAEETGALRSFLDVAGVVDLLDDEAGRFGRSEELVQRIRAAAGQRTDHSVVPLTPRELALLVELPAQMTLSEIAARHQVSLNTVKTQARSIYQKLEASGRRDAVAKARHRGLL
ncbi:putative Transcriptional regulator [Modestobacter italicus]|uniref:Transcriptional regulator n=1 Tax=Modestobacter italicus (strain DSM 44449 / CECT 9708 / BC 501) TaxID=2732864 RepID=I4EUB2_MODI5|nr:LuxR C-terminal-related transcriptional regulator [Modestobacter marinus]CCH86975.1 putative Transcriptional regulator [Modestobacter marinus]